MKKEKENIPKRSWILFEKTNDLNIYETKNCIFFNLFVSSRGKISSEIKFIWGIRNCFFSGKKPHVDAGCVIISSTIAQSIDVMSLVFIQMHKNLTSSLRWCEFLLIYEEAYQFITDTCPVRDVSSCERLWLQRLINTANVTFMESVAGLVLPLTSLVSSTLQKHWSFARQNINTVMSRFCTDPIKFARKLSAALARHMMSDRMVAKSVTRDPPGANETRLLLLHESESRQGWLAVYYGFHKVFSSLPAETDHSASAWFPKICFCVHFNFS